MLQIASVAPPIPTLQGVAGEVPEAAGRAKLPHCRPRSENGLYLPTQGAEVLPSAEPEHPNVSLQGDATGQEAHVPAMVTLL